MVDQAAEAPGSIVDDEDYLDNRISLGQRIGASWRDMRAATRQLIDERPSEHRLIFFVHLSDIIFFVAWSLKTVVSPVSALKEHVPLQIGALLIGALLARTLTMYVFSLFLTGVARAAGGKGSWRDTRTGVFWAALVAAPIGLLVALITGLMSWLEPTFPILSADWVALPPTWISLVPFCWFVSLGLAEAQGFKSHRIAFWTMLVTITVAMGVIALLWTRGLI